ncbi:MAG: hypothetical protein ACOX0I_02535 [Bacilli bacterium]|jgi:hypothetical protein
MIREVLNLIAAILYLLVGGYIIFKFKDRLPYKIITVVLTFLIFVPYVFSLINFYRKDSWWNFNNVLPTSNISSLMFTMVFVVLFLPKIIKKHFYLLMTMLSFTMIVAGIGSPIWYMFFDRYYPFFSIEWITHFTMAFFGIYLLLTKRIEITVKNCLKALMIIYMIVAIMIVLNIIFGTSFFGLAFNGEHHIYRHIIIPNPYLSALVYITGVTFFLVTGYFFLKFIKKIDEKRAVVVDEEQTT